MGKLDSPKYYFLRFKESKDKLNDKIKLWLTAYYKPMAVQPKLDQTLETLESDLLKENPNLKAMFKHPYSYRFYLNLALNVIQ
jgi:hypothetical protein